MFGAESPVPARTTDINLPYDGPWGDVDPNLRQMITRSAEKYALPIDSLFKQVQAESGFDPTAGNPSGAQGLMQLIPLMQKHYGLTDPLDPAQNLDAGSKYMRELLDKYDQNYPLALAAYNAGPTAVRKAKGIPKFKETQAYIQKILGGS